MKKHRYKLITTGILFTTATAIIHFMNHLISTTAIMKDLLKSTASNYYNWRFGKIYYTKQGTGSPVLLIHDLTIYSSAYEWEALVKQLEKNHTVYCIDLPGCGRSDKQHITYTNYLYVQAISDFIKNVIHERTDVITSGFSGSFTILACHNENELFRKILMINPPALSQLNKIPTKRSKLYKSFLELPVFGTLVYNMMVCQSNVQLAFTEDYLYNPFHIKAEWLDTYYEAAHKGMGSGRFLFSSLLGGYTNNNIVHALKNINNSIFIIEGGGELTKCEVLSQYVELNPAIETYILKEAKHLPQLESPEQLFDCLSVFLDD